jgi:hypothetical protein
VAPERPGDFFDGTEIDEMLTLRILTLTDAEKREVAAVDERSRSRRCRGGDTAAGVADRSAASWRDDWLGVKPHYS